MKISLIIPTRERPGMLFNCLKSLSQMTLEPKDVEILIVVDEDNKPTQDYVKANVNAFKMFDCKMLVRPYSIYLNEDYYNWAARQSVGDLIWIFADDLVVVQNKWDEVLKREAASYLLKYPDGIFSIGLKDNTPPPSHRLPKFPCFPIFHRNVMKATGGWLLHPKPCNWGVDYINYAIFMPLDRLLLINNANYINHVSHHNKQVPCDATSIRIGQIFNQTKMRPEHNTDRILSEEVPVIQNQIKDYLKVWQEQQKIVM
jgi:glycosyltransferase involved in cell wall biosynthesis